ncbi:hypothetical protein FB45DRAFT_997002 [Roridomyces roridus]|uniref:Uncharacterized protein n=1 Tax=Roridomyces roridus TaxID=1738132 RepID=A0AAD7CHU3_9AGAR|nr:hypothetical protein FB45DRAFT_997002 [Roridomyces roridus]
MSDTTRCRGLDSDGQQCICLRADTTYVDENNKTKCTDCDHIASAHPQAKANFSTLIRGFRDAAKLPNPSSTPLKASQADAEAETAAGLRGGSVNKKRKKDSQATSGESSSKKPNPPIQKTPAAPPPTSSQTKVKYCHAFLLPYGLTADGALSKGTLPDAAERQKLESAKLIVHRSTANPFIINTTWNNDSAKAAVADLFPQAHRYMEHHFPWEMQPWSVVTAFKSVLTLRGEQFPDGEDLGRHVLEPFKGRVIQDRTLYLVSKERIPRAHWKDWDTYMLDSDLGSDIDTVPSEDIKHTPVKARPAYKGKGKGKANDPIKEETEDIPVKEEKSFTSLDYSESDMRKAARIRTRLSSVLGAIEKQTFSIPGSSPEPEASGSQEVTVISDDEDLPPLFLAQNSPSPPSPSPPSPSPPPFMTQTPHASTFGGMSTAPSFTGGLAPPATAGPATPASLTAAPVAPLPPAPAPAVPLAALFPTIPSFAAAGVVIPQMPDNGGETPAPPSAGSSATHRFRRMGRGRHE